MLRKFARAAAVSAGLAGVLAPMADGAPERLDTMWRSLDFAAYQPPLPAQPAIWVTTWATAMQGPYPVGFPFLEPDLTLAIPDPKAGARDQSFRIVVNPTLWGRQLRLRFSNRFGNRPIVFEDVYVGLQQESAAVVGGTNKPVFFSGSRTLRIDPGQEHWSDDADLPFVSDDVIPFLAGRKLAVSFRVRGESGPMTWHAKGLTTSYLTAPHSKPVSAREDDGPYPYSTTSTFFLAAVDMRTSDDAKLVVAFGDALTDGMGATLNGEDRWTNVLARRLRARFGNRVAVVNLGIAGNRVLSPERYTADHPDAGGPSGLSRASRELLALSGVTAVIWLEGTNDLGPYGNATLDDLKQGFTKGVNELRSAMPGVKILGATIPSAHGSRDFGERDNDRISLNAFLATSGLFDGLVDFDRVTLDPRTGGLKPAFAVPTNGVGPLDGVHPNRAGYLAMGHAINLDALVSEIEDAGGS